MTTPHVTERFSDRVDDYVRARPGYPDEMLPFLHDVCGWAPDTVVADLGSGTGISAEWFLRRGNTVYAVEPNEPMRRAAEARLGQDERFHSVAATAEATGLEAGSIQLVVAAQAFHWFDRAKVRQEVLRILVPGGHAAIIWNARRRDSTPFLRGYEQLLRTFGTDYQEVRYENVSEADLRAFFGGDFRRGSFPNVQVFDFEGLEGRLLSSSFVPKAGDSRYAPMLDELRRLFDAHQEDGRVRMEYDTLVYGGPVRP